MDWMIGLAFNVLFGLLESGLIPTTKYRAFRKLALAICRLLPPSDAVAVIDEVQKEVENRGDLENARTR
jgi:hypothetical protein